MSKGLNKNLSFTLRPLNEKSLDLSQSDHSVYQNISQGIFTNKSKSIELKVFPIKYNIEYNSNTPYNRNNGTMIPNVGYQHLVSFDYTHKLDL